MKTITLITALLLASFIIKAQPGYKLLPDSALTLFQSNNPQEKVFLQTDRGNYLAGETIWMKAWCLLDEEPTYLSKILYVDVTDPNGNVLLKKMFQLDSLSSCSGYFEVPVEVASGTYSINAYTMWMKNFPEYIFKKGVQLYGSDYLDNKKIIPVRDKVTLNIFPEGGNLIAGLNNRIGFKATDAYQLPFHFSGYIKDDSGKKIVDIISSHDGMGATEFVVEPDKNYTAVINKSVGQELTFSLPKALEEGIVLRVENTNPNKVFIIVNVAEKNKAHYSKVNIVAQTNYTTVLKASVDLTQGQSALALNKKELPAGILQITIFNENYLPLAERIVFIENYKLIKPDLNIITKNFEPKGLNRISFTTSQHSHQSLSCIITSYLPGVSPHNSIVENIASCFLLTSDLKGYIHNPGYYFKDKAPETLRKLDLLLLTQGWRRFEWKEIMNNAFAHLKYPVESSIQFKGKVFKNNSKTPVENGFVSFIINAADSTKSIVQADLNNKGEFFLTDINFKKVAKIFYMGTDRMKANNIVEVKLEPNYIDSLKKSPNISIVNFDTISLQKQTDDFSKSTIEKLNEQKAKTLETVTVKGKQMRPEDKLNEQYSTGPFRVLQGYVIDPSSQRVGKTIWQMIQERVPGVKLEYNADNPIDPLVSFGRFEAFAEDQGFETETETHEERGIAYFLNEIKVPKDVVNNINVEDVAFIKVMKNEAAALGARQGAIAIYTKYGGDGSRAVFEKGYNAINVAGYEIVKNFYQPEYAYDPSKSNMPDNRQTLYWNGNMAPFNKKYNIQFYNNDIGKKYQVTIQGMNKIGEFVYFHQILD